MMQPFMGANEHENKGIFKTSYSLADELVEIEEYSHEEDLDEE